MILMAYRHGLRASEVCDLRLADIDVKVRQISIRRLKGSLSTIRPIERHWGQPLLDELRALIRWLRERRHDGSEFLFVSQKGGRLGRSQFFRIFKACAEEAGLPAKKCHPHALKHSLATHLISENVNLAWVSARLGHSSVQTTEAVYTRVLPETHRAMADVMEAVLRHAWQRNAAQAGTR